MKVLSLGAGVQSSTLLMLSERGLLPRLDHAIFADVGWEPPEVYAWLDWLKAHTSIPVHTVSAGNLRADVMHSAKTGDRVSNPPLHAETGILIRKCTRDYKVRPITRKVRELNGGKTDPPVEQWLGISRDEAQRMKPSQVAWITIAWPLVWDLQWSRADCLQWWADEGLPEPPRSSCIGCPYHGSHEWARIRSDDALWADACEVDEAIRDGISGTEQRLYLHQSRLPLREAIDDDKQGSLFGGECGGWCGV